MTTFGIASLVYNEESQTGKAEVLTIILPCIRKLLILYLRKSKLTNSVALVRERAIPTEQPPLVGDVNANFWG
jgi:hypothetical protein